MSAKGQVNELIREKRKALGLPEAEISESCGLSIMEYHDLEAYPDEAFAVLRLGNLLCVCDRLDLEIGQLFGWQAGARLSHGEMAHKDIISRIRESRGLSVAELSDAAGVKEQGIEQAETDTSTLLAWPVEFVKALADALQLSPMDLISVVRRQASE
ncbi:MAG: helix-turn-helix transcriptional regulator [Kiloniellales bacterium]|nr:helix-turn-helix transcriptional regulator [Kiloniellales bacterium]